MKINLVGQQPDTTTGVNNFEYDGDGTESPNTAKSDTQPNT